ncbi:F-box/kelch-repeat protein At3g06240-like [Papaver somniferum]|uniref:F-box/kelch-repeat protein At3g06240-like n=1 Tax=Papaver somniferum TaxID=3469 RepID=UPI000E6F797F|nr:F-box/kelch-repeat protein At3g06240-like [Papaver somniferum]
MMNNCHDDIVLNILVRLPVKSIGRYRCVSRYCCRLLTDPRFVKQHLNHILGLKKLGLVLSSYYNFHNDIYMIRYDPLSSVSNGLVIMKDPLKSERVTLEMEVLGYCHGLVCIRPMFMGQVFLWNPCTKEYRKLPLRPIESSSIISYIKYGFGYDCKMEDYKVVSFVGYKDEHDCEVQVFTLGSNCWRKMNRIPYDLSCNDIVNQVPVNGSHQLTFDGALHWIAKTDSVVAEDSKVMISFDLEKEIFKEIPLPMGFNERFRPQMCVIGGTLCLLEYKAEVGFEVWQSKDYGGSKCWNKILTFGRQQLVSPVMNFTPLQILKNGEILSVVRTDVTFHLVLHERGTCRILEFKELETYSVESSVFVESVVSLNSKTYVGHAEKEYFPDVVGFGNNEYWKTKTMKYWKYMCLFSIFLLGWSLSNLWAKIYYI